MAIRLLPLKSFHGDAYLYLGLTKATEKEPHLIMSFTDIGEYHSKAMKPNIRKPKLRTKGDTSPHITVTDEIGYIYETDRASRLDGWAHSDLVLLHLLA